MTNTGNQTWPAGGGRPRPPRRPLHSPRRRRSVSYNSWRTDQRFSLPADLAPGASATLTISVTAPTTAGSLIVEYQMVKETRFWFSQFADVNVAVA